MRDPDENGSHVRGLRTLITSAAIGIAVLYCSDRSIAAIFHTPSGLVTAVSFVRAQLWPEENNSTSVTSTSGVKAGSGITISTAKADSARRSITANRVGLQSAHAVAQKLLPATPALLPDNFDSNASLRASNAMFNSVIASPLLRQRRSDATLPVPEAALVTPTKADNNGVTKPASGGGSAQLIASDGAAGDQFGRSVSFSGNSALAGAWRDNSSQGSAYLFRNLDTASGTITQNVKLTASDGAAFDYFGYSVSLSGNSALVGAYGDGIGSNSFQGSAYLFRNLDTASGTITQNVKLTASDGAASDLFGYSVSLSGNSALAGAYGDNSYQGSAYLFRNLDTASGTTTQNVKLTASDGAADDYFGYSVSLSGNSALVGAYYGDGIGSNSGQGSAYFFRNLDTASGTITQNVKLTASDGAASDYFGYSVSLSGNSALVGAYDDGIGSNFGQGSAYLFRNLDTASGTITQNAKLTASDGAVDHFGVSVSLWGNSALVGAFGSNSGRGSAYLFRNLDTASGTITENVKLTASDGANSDFFGDSVSLDGDQFVIGALQGDGAAADSGKAYTGTVSSVTTLDAGNATRTIDGISFISRDDWIIGQTTEGNQVTLTANDSANVTAAGKAVYIGKEAGSDNNILQIDGSVTANVVNIGAASGTSGNSVQISETGKLSSGSILVNSGGTLLLTGTNTSTDRIDVAAAITLAGGTFNTGGLSERGGTPAAPTAGVGALTLTANSTIDFGAGSSSILEFAGIGTHMPLIGADLMITNWDGMPITGNGTERLLFAGTSSSFTTQYAQTDVFFDGLQGYAAVQFSGYYEITGLAPVPEPATWISGALVVGLIGWTQLRKRASRLRSERLVRNYRA